MQMTALLLVSAVVMLISPGAANPLHHLQNLKQIIDLVNNYPDSKDFVEDVSHLVHAGCEDKFFCKVHDILISHGKKEGQNKELKYDNEKIRRNLYVYIKSTQVNCEEVLKTVPKTEIKQPMLKLLENLKTCSHKIIFTSGIKNHTT